MKVWRGASLHKDDRKIFSKVSGRDSLQTYFFTNSTWPQCLNKELATWSRLNHPNIATFLGVASYGGHLPALVLPFYANGNALDYVKNHPDTNILRLVSGILNNRSSALRIDGCVNFS